MRTIIAALAVSLATTVSAHAACFVGASVGATTATSRLDDGSSRIDLGSQAPVIGPEIGCAFGLEGWRVTPGFLVRYDLTNLRATIDANKLQSPGRWMAAATMGYQLNPNAGIYGLAGLSGSKIEVPSIASASTLSLVLGAGVNLDIGQTGWSAFAEYNRIIARGVDLGGVNVKGDENLVRVGARMKLGQ